MWVKLGVRVRFFRGYPTRHDCAKKRKESPTGKVGDLSLRPTGNGAHLATEVNAPHLPGRDCRELACLNPSLVLNLR